MKHKQEIFGCKEGLLVIALKHIICGSEKHKAWTLLGKFLRPDALTDKIDFLTSPTFYKHKPQNT